MDWRASLRAMLIAAALVTVPASAWAEPAAESTMRVLPGIAQRISEHVSVIPANGRPGVPNVGIITGSRAVLIVDSGLGNASGQVVLEEVRKIASGKRIYVIATHAHPEHFGGEQAISPQGILLRSRVQQGELEATGAQMVAGFRAISKDNAGLLEDFVFSPADVLFDAPLSLDLGGVSVDILGAGPAHTDGDLALLVREDGVLFTGDIVQPNYAPLPGGEHSSLDSWLKQIDRLEALPAAIIVPSHTVVTDRESFADMRAMVTFVRDRWAAIREMDLAEDAGRQQLVADFKARYPTASNADLLGFPSMKF